MHSLSSDLSLITSIPEKTVNKFFKKMILCIGENALEQFDGDFSKIIKIDIGIGNLYIKYIDNEFKYHFEPSDLLNKTMKNNVLENNSVLISALKDTMSKKFTETYKDILT